MFRRVRLDISYLRLIWVELFSVVCVCHDASSTSPANSPDVITVSAIVDSDGKCGGIGKETFVGRDDVFANFSNHGSVVDMAAPGVDIFSTYIDDEYGVDTGTSVAAPHVAGAAALYKSHYPLATPSEVRDALLALGSTSTNICDGNGRGYFEGDVDGFREPVLNVKDIE